MTESFDASWEAEKQAERAELLNQKNSLFEQLDAIGKKKWALLDRAAERRCDDLLASIGLAPDNLPPEGELLAKIREKIKDPDDRLLLFVRKINNGLVSWNRADDIAMHQRLESIGITRQNVEQLDRETGFSKLPTPSGGLYHKLEEKLLEKMSPEERAQMLTWEAELGPLRAKTEEVKEQLKTLEEEQGWSGS